MPLYPCVKDIFKKTLNYESEKSIGLFTFFDNNQNVKSAFVKKDKKLAHSTHNPNRQMLCYTEQKKTAETGLRAIYDK